MAMYRKKPVVIEAVQWRNTNQDELLDVFGRAVYRWDFAVSGSLFIPTLEGKMEANVGDWIIKGVKGEFYPCKPDIFEQLYTRAD